MKKHILATTLLSVLFVSGCSTTNGGAWDKFTDLVSKAMPFVQESEEWEAYSIQKTTQGVIYSEANSNDKQFVEKKMAAEYSAAIDRLARPFATNEKTNQELTKENQNYQFKYNRIMTVKDKTSSNTIGYCVNYDSDRLENGKIKVVPESDQIRKSFIYVDRSKPVSIATSGEDFIKRMCGENFYNKYKGTN